MRYRKDVDGLRAIAVGAVLLMHGFHDVFPNGFLGVDVFFVISGFVITTSLLGRRPTGFGEFVASFYARRFLRLLPALVVVLVVTSVLISLLAPRPSDFLKTALAAAFGFGNMALFFAQQDYFADSASLNPFTHTWSLGVEEQFYFVAPLLLWAVTRHSGLRQYFVVTSALLVLSLLSWIAMQGTDPEAAFYLMPFRFWELAVGCLVAVALNLRHKDMDPGPQRQDGLLWSGRLGGLAVLIMLALLLVPVQLPLIPTTLAVVLCTCAALLADISARPVGRVLVSAPVNLVGRASYSIYLWHWPLLVLALWSIGDGPWTTVGLLALSVLMGWLTMVLIENPVRFGFRPRNRTAILSGFAMMLVGAAVPGFIAKTKPALYLGEPPEMIALGTPSLSDSHVGISGGTWDGEACVLSSNAEVGKQIDVARCTFGDPQSAERRVMVFGNSYSASFVRAFPLVAAQADALVTVTSSWGASPVAGVPNGSRWSEANDYYWQSVVPSLTSTLGEGDEVLLVNDLNGFASITGYEPTQNFAAFEHGLKRFAQELSASGVQLNIIGPLPFARDAQCDPSMAVPQWYAPNGAPCIFYTRKATLAGQAELRTMLGRLEAESVLNVIDMDSIFCPEETCSYFGRDGLILYRDQFSHPSVEAAIAAAGPISAEVMN